MPWQYSVRSDKDTHFTGAIAQDAAEAEDIAFPGALTGVKGHSRSLIRSIAVVSDQNLAWELMFWGKDSKANADLGVDTFISRWPFITADAVQIAGTGLYYYYIEGFDIPYHDEDNTGELHVSLINRSVTAKNAGATGEVVVKVTMQPMGSEGGWQ